MRILILLGTLLTLGADWPQHLGPNRDGLSSETGLARTWPKDGPALIWEKTAGSGWSAPVVAGERAVLFYRVGNQEIIECVAAATGKELWKQSYKTRYVDEFNFDDGPRATPLIAGDKVFTFGADGELSAFDLAKGDLVWQKNINKEYMPAKGYFGVATSPMIVAGKLLINVGAKGAGVVAFDPENGREIWKTSDQAVSYSSPVAAKIDGEELAVFFTRQGLLALTPEKGEIRYEHSWRPRINASVNAATPLVSGNQIFLSTSYNTGAVLLETAKGSIKEIWKNDESLSCHFNTPVRVNDHLFGIDGRQEGRAKLRCIEWNTGKVAWSKDEFGCAALVAVDSMLLALVENGDLVLLEQSTTRYKELARATILGGKVRAAFALAGGSVIARDGAKWVCVNVKK